jgi:hypothetical protein
MMEQLRHLLHRSWIAAAALIVALGGATAEAAPPGVVKLTDTQLDPTALFFVSFDGLVNNASYQQSAILSRAGFQYAAWYTASRSVVVARRKLPAGAWETVVLPHQLSTNDSHNSISLGISPTDGRLHIAMDTHDTTVFYVKSEAALVSDPANRTWVASRFGPVQRTLDGVDLGTITYPQFVVTPEQVLQFSYRTGRSGAGTNELAEYTGSWRALGKWSAGTGNYAQHGATSTSRNMYLHGIQYGPGGRLHAAFTWREDNAAVMCNAGGLANHDTGYVFSDDRGRTWRNNAGQQVAVTGSATSQVAVGSPGLVVDPLNVDHALINQESEAIDSTGAPHVIISYVPGRFTQCVSNFETQRPQFARAFHLTRNAQGAWTKFEIPVALNAFGRSQIVLDSANNAFVVLPFGRIVSASAASGWTDWAVQFDGSGLGAFGEVVVDRDRLASDGVLSIMYQRSSTGTTPSPIRVIDFQLQ